MLSAHDNKMQTAPVDGRHDATREARADARFAARQDARAFYACRQRNAMELIEAPAAQGYLALRSG